MRQNKPKIKIFLISILIILIDQISKVLSEKLLIDGSSLTLLPGLIQFRLVRNTGAAFSIMSGSTDFLAYISLLASIGISILIIQKRTFKFWEGIGFALLLGGCIGNGIDRWTLGYVIDFVELMPVNFPIFNFADISINLAVLCFMLDTIKSKVQRNV